jgi:hypothetical protein
MQFESPEIVLDSMSGIVTPLKADNKISVPGEIIDHAALALISPVDPDDDA